MMLNLHRLVTKLVNRDVCTYGIISMEPDKGHCKFNKNQKSVEREHYGLKQMIKVWYSTIILSDASVDFFSGNIWRTARVNIPPLLGMGTYKILIVGIVGATTTVGEKRFSFRFVKTVFLLSLIRSGYRRCIESRGWMSWFGYLHIRGRSLHLVEWTKWCCRWFRLVT